MVRAIWNDTVLAESSSTVVVEGNQYFPLANYVAFWKGVSVED